MEGPLTSEVLIEMVPVKNIYFMFCYAWNLFNIGNKISVGFDDSLEAQDLLAKVLIHATKAAVRKGLDRDYIIKYEDLSCPKGKIIFGETVKRNLLEKKKVHSTFDEFSHNVLHNQIIKSTLKKITKTKIINEVHRNEARMLFQKLFDVDDIDIVASDFYRVKIHRNNAHYEFLMKLCELIHQSLLPTEDGEGFQFSKFLDDEKRMGPVFEAFVRNFFALEQCEYQVGSEEIRWDATASNDYDMAYLPRMVTDISLKSKTRKIIIDTKYYKNTLQKNRNYSEKIHSANIYQLHSYLSNSEAKDKYEHTVEGILLYPTVDKALDLNYIIRGHKIRIVTLNLNQEWKSLKNDLLNLPM